MSYDVAIIVDGPAGLFAAYELITKKKDLKLFLLDRGAKVGKRVCSMNKKEVSCQNCNPCAILSGYGVAGTFSNEIETNDKFCLKNDSIYFIGDGAGKAGNIVTAAATGLVAVRDIIERCKHES